ncbi:FkbM family methyltransferase [Anthocerotibacter panamensis]|uniref:FkbM family methyltransferase n=1 Tax=Anthocerotibacter panamensis TaxID=2857077 RepID=UPI001C404D73|nr:FkbM family methyltransferase [Anthocerotibacter panamensis]
MGVMIDSLKAILPDSVKKFMTHLKFEYLNDFSVKSYAQEGEDIILKRVFDGFSSGFYIDVGAHHPRRFSNTYLFYKKGWSGINIDAMPGSMKRFNRQRPRDINLEIAIAREMKSMTYYIFNEPALNSFDRDLSLQRENEKYRIVETRDIVTQRLHDVLIKYLPKNQKINFLSIDVEGLDLEVLMSNDWQKFRPAYVLVESLNIIFNEIRSNPTFELMQMNGYELYAKTGNTLIYKNTQNQLS